MIRSCFEWAADHLLQHIFVLIDCVYPIELRCKICGELFEVDDLATHLIAHRRNGESRTR